MKIKQIKKRKYLIFFSLAILFGILFCFCGVDENLEMSFNEKGILVLPERGIFENHQAHAERMMILYEEYQDAFREDDFGGVTPQETLNLFIKALEKGDLELASRYLTVNSRKIELSILEDMSKEHILKYVDILKAGFFEYYDMDKTRAELRSIVEGENVIIYRFIRNNDKNIWKIEEL